jgi:hypothetical protein
MVDLAAGETVCGEARFKDGIGQRSWAHLPQDATHSNFVGDNGDHA